MSLRDEKVKTNISQGKIYVAHICRHIGYATVHGEIGLKPALNLGSWSHKLRVNIILAIWQVQILLYVFCVFP